MRRLIIKDFSKTGYARIALLALAIAVGALISLSYYQNKIIMEQRQVIITLIKQIR